MMTMSESLIEFASSVVERARRRGATAAEVYVRRGVETEIAVREGRIETLLEGGPKSVGLRVWRGERSAATYATDFSEEGLDRLVEDSLGLAALLDPVPEAALVDADRLCFESRDLDLFDAEVAKVSAEDKMDTVRETEAAALGRGAREAAGAGADGRVAARRDAARARPRAPRRSSVGNPRRCPRPRPRRCLPEVPWRHRSGALRCSA